jgi:hypothetical protein
LHRNKRSRGSVVPKSSRRCAATGAASRILRATSHRKGAGTRSSVSTPSATRLALLSQSSLFDGIKHGCPGQEPAVYHERTGQSAGRNAREHSQNQKWLNRDQALIRQAVEGKLPNDSGLTFSNWFGDFSAPPLSTLTRGSTSGRPNAHGMIWHDSSKTFLNALVFLMGKTRQGGQSFKTSRLAFRAKLFTRVSMNSGSGRLPERESDGR